MGETELWPFLSQNPIWLIEGYRKEMNRRYFGQHCLKFISVTILKLAKQILQVYILAYHVFDPILYIYFILFNSYKLVGGGGP